MGSWADAEARATLRAVFDAAVAAADPRRVLPAHLPHYIAHLRELGLVEEGPELKAQDVQYQILEGDGVVRQAIAPAERQSLLGDEEQARLLQSYLDRHAEGAAYRSGDTWMPLLRATGADSLGQP